MNDKKITGKFFGSLYRNIVKTRATNVPIKPIKQKEKEEDDKSVNLHLTTLNDVFQYPEPNFLIEPLIVEGTVSILGAYSGVGKSIVSLSIMKSILTGDPLWGRYRVNKIGPVLLVDEETPQGFLRERTTKMGFTPDLPFYFLHFQDVRLDQEMGYQALLARIEEVKPVMIVIDSLVRVHRQREDDAISMSLVISRLRKIANSGTTVLVIHHHKKGEGPLNQKLRGSTDIVAGIDLEYALLTRDNHLVFTSVKTRTQPIVPIKLQMEANNNHIALIYKGEENGEEGEVVTEVIELLGQCGEAGVDEIFRDLKDRDVKIGINKLREMLKKANGKDLIEKIGQKGKMIYTLNQTN
jgi:hypothetical protein